MAVRSTLRGNVILSNSRWREEVTEENVKMNSYYKMCVINETGNIKTDKEAHLLFLFLFLATSKSDFSH